MSEADLRFGRASCVRMAPMTAGRILMLVVIGVLIFVALLVLELTTRALEADDEPDRVVAAQGVPSTITTTSTTTTSTTQPVARARTAPIVRSASVSRPVVYGTGACGGDLPPCWVMKRESGGNIRAVNPTGCGGRGCYGKWQFDPRTWAGYGGFQFASDAPEEVQDAKARQLWAGGRGCSHWAAC